MAPHGKMKDELMTSFFCLIFFWGWGGVTGPVVGCVHQERDGAGDVDSVAGLRGPLDETGPPRQRMATSLLSPQRRLSLLLRRYQRTLSSR